MRIRRAARRWRPRWTCIASCKAVTPTQYQPLLHDLFAANTYWELSASQAQAKKSGDGRWQVTLDLRARKLLVDDAGAEIERPLDEWVEIGVYPGRGAQGRRTAR